MNKKVLKRTFVDVWSDWEKIVKKPKDFKQFKKEIKNKKINKIWRRAKNIIFDLSDGPALSRAEGYSLLVHQKMTGHLLGMENGIWNMEHGNRLEKGPLNDPYNRFLHLIFFLDDKKMIAFQMQENLPKLNYGKQMTY